MPTRKKHSGADQDKPWEHTNPREASGEPAHHLTASQKASAKRHAKEAGRPYPNLVDNMHAAAAAGHKTKKKP